MRCTNSIQNVIRTFYHKSTAIASYLVSDMVQLNLNFTHACRYTCVLAHLTRAKLQKLACACTVARDFGVHTRDSKHTRHTRDAHHELVLGLPCTLHVWYNSGTVAVGNEIQLLCS